MQFLIPTQHRAAAGVYAIRNSIDNRVYVGSALHLERRFLAHKRSLLKGGHHAARLQDFVNQHGIGVCHSSCWR
jgi:predicted GIY-YIG superfamily endonuclease